jgi:Protein of unknown function (DUF3037)
MTRYMFSIVRFVPDPGRGECVNVGAIVGSDVAGDWEFSQVSNARRARAIDEVGALSAVDDFFLQLGPRIDQANEALETGNDPDVSEAWLMRLYEDQQHVVQLSRPAPVSADSAEDALAQVFSDLVVDPVTTSLGYLRRDRASSTLRKAYEQQHLARDINVFERVTLQAGAHSELMDFAVANGHVVQLAHAWSFQLPNQGALMERVRSWGWSLQRLRHAGGTLRLRGQSVDLPRDLDIEVLYAPPVAGQVDTRAFGDGMGVFETLGIEAYPLEEAERIAQRAEQDLVG